MSEKTIVNIGDSIAFLQGTTRFCISKSNYEIIQDEVLTCYYKFLSV